MLLDLYDPDRSQSVRHEGRPVGWDVLEAALAGRAAMLDATGGEGFRLLTGATTSPTLKRQIAELLQRWPARSEEHTSELQSLMRISYAVFCLKKQKNNNTQNRACYEHTKTRKK